MRVPQETLRRVFQKRLLQYLFPLKKYLESASLLLPNFQPCWSCQEKKIVLQDLCVHKFQLFETQRIIQLL
uniref:Uncharacterized protein MANES_05G065800 n=1 Tax=Rhizophora mucronata TaxID=61149 RepID=A0A2P2JG22_RHIMU